MGWATGGIPRVEGRRAIFSLLSLLIDVPPAHTLDLSPRASLRSSQASGRATRRNIRKAVANGVRVQDIDHEGIGQAVLQAESDDQEGARPPASALSFFRRDPRARDLERARIRGGRIPGRRRPIAASVYFHFGKAAIYKYGASDKRYQHLRPNNLVMWEAIRWCIQDGYTSLSLGRTDLDDEGLRQFKNGLGRDGTSGELLPVRHQGRRLCEQRQRESERDKQQGLFAGASAGP